MSNIVIISGSHRPGGNTPRVARHIAGLLESRGHTAPVVDLAQTQLPLWDEGMWGVAPLAEKWEKLWKPLAARLAEAEAFVVASPEYHGMVPAALTNFFLLAGNGPLLAHKPALAVGVSASVNGAYPISELKAFTSKNNRIAYLPEHFILRHAGEMFTGNPKPEHAAADAYNAERLAWCLTLLEDYVEPFKAIRAKGHTMNDKFANGM